MDREKINNWGGRRPGSGRKLHGERKNEMITFRITSRGKEALQALATAKGKSIGQLIEDMIFERDVVRGDV